MNYRRSSVDLFESPIRSEPHALDRIIPICLCWPCQASCVTSHWPAPMCGFFLALKMNGAEKTRPYQRSFNLVSWPAFQTFLAVQCSGTLPIDFAICSDEPAQSLRASVVFDQLIGLHLESVDFKELLCISGDFIVPLPLISETRNAGIHVLLPSESSGHQPLHFYSATTLSHGF